MLKHEIMGTNQVTLGPYIFTGKPAWWNMADTLKLKFNSLTGVPVRIW